MPPKGGVRQQLQRRLEAEQGARSRSPQGGSDLPPNSYEPGGHQDRPLLGGMRASAMMAGSSRDPDPPAATVDEIAFKNHVARLFLNNKFSGPETVELVQKAFKAGAGGVSGLQRAAKQGEAIKNAARDLKRRLGKDLECPELYWAKIAVWDEDEGCSVLIDFPFILPHELFATILEGIERPWECLGHLEPHLATLID